MSTANTALTGHTVLVTRPAHQAGPLCRLIEAAGGAAEAVPALEIIPRPDQQAARAELEALRDCDIAVFVSANAVDQSLALLAPDPLPGPPALAAVGRGTAAALKAQGYTDVVHPEHRFDSEGLLETPLFRSVDGRTVAIVRGEGGRQWLAGALGRAGARVRPIVVYRRGLPEDAAPALRAALAAGRITLAAISSNAGLDNLLTMAGEEYADALRALPAAVPSDRTRDFARERGFRAPIQVAAGAEDKMMIRALGELATRITRR